MTKCQISESFEKFRRLSKQWIDTSNNMRGSRFSKTSKSPIFLSKKSLMEYYISMASKCLLYSKRTRGSTTTFTTKQTCTHRPVSRVNEIAREDLCLLYVVYLFDDSNMVAFVKCYDVFPLKLLYFFLADWCEYYQSCRI